MPRPVKCRKVCHFPRVLEFLPAHAEAQRPPILMTVDEYETIRLIDKEGQTPLFLPNLPLAQTPI